MQKLVKYLQNFFGGAGPGAPRPRPGWPGYLAAAALASMALRMLAGACLASMAGLAVAQLVPLGKVSVMAPSAAARIGLLLLTGQPAARHLA